MPLSVDIDVHDERLASLVESLGNAGAGWIESFGKYMLDRTAETFERLAHGGTFRGAGWAPFKNKPPARRGGWSARLLDDTGELKAGVGEIFEIRDGSLKLGTRAPYAAGQNKTRPFLFFHLPDDLATAADMAKRFIEKAGENGERTITK